MSSQLDVFSLMFKVRVSEKYCYEGHEISFVLRDIQEC